MEGGVALAFLRQAQVKLRQAQGSVRGLLRKSVALMDIYFVTTQPSY